MPKNNPTITASNLITFFKAYPIKMPTKNPPPIVAAVGAKLSIFIILDAAPTFSCNYVMTIFISLW
jgi:hypothetical protein